VKSWRSVIEVGGGDGGGDGVHAGRQRDATHAFDVNFAMHVRELDVTMLPAPRTLVGDAAGPRCRGRASMPARATALMRQASVGWETTKVTRPRRA
jgi:hypothetical protein